ncbi:DUF1631 family protein [Ideonella sp.]|uniref:DUF1631 family protein n=1 Tax=Ideonella sp. TaxID=1929293 RepID=UPI0035AFDE85
MSAVPPSPPGTLFQRYLAHCRADAQLVLDQVCREAAAPAAGAAIWVTPAQRQARQLLPGLAAEWAEQAARPPEPPRPTTAPAPFVATDFGVPTGLALMSDDDVDEDIESTRVVQTVESSAEWHLRDLRARLAGAPEAAGWSGDEPVPLAPARLVGALCAVLHARPIDAPVRLAALRLVATPLGHVLPALYQRHVQLLEEWGVQPARYAIRREPDTRGAPRRADPSAPAGTDAAPPAGLGAAAGRIPALLAHVASQAGLNTEMQGLMTRLAGPVARSVAADPSLLDSVDNPLWRLIDRLAAIGQLDTDAARSPFQLPLHLRLEPIIASLEAARGAVPAARYAQALAAAEAEAGTVADSTRPIAGDPTAPSPLQSAPWAPATTGLSEPLVAAAERRRELEPLVRGQMVDRLRDTVVVPEVKQFLLGPWLGVVLEAVVRHGEEATEAQRVLGAVEHFIDAGHLQRHAPLTPAELDCLRLEAEDGLHAHSALPGAKIQQHARELRAALAVWPREAVLDAGWAPAPPPMAPSAPGDELALPRHDELATVPAALDALNPDERALRASDAWLDGLAVGDICRIQRQGQWATLRLNWRGEGGSYFAFGNSAGVAFCVSRRVLGRLRLEGLATTMARGQWVRRAMDTLPASRD